jgi:hypothetical protein
VDRRIHREYEKLIAEGKYTVQKDVMETHVYFELLEVRTRGAASGHRSLAYDGHCDSSLVQAYVKSYLPRPGGEQLEGGGQGVDVERVLRMSVESEIFLRTLIEMWMERNSVLNPESPYQQQPPESTDCANRLSDLRLDCPPMGVMKCLLLLSTHVLGRRAELDVATQANSRTQRPLVLCPAQDALHQPTFILLQASMQVWAPSRHDPGPPNPSPYHHISSFEPVRAGLDDAPTRAPPSLHVSPAAPPHGRLCSAP